MADSIGGLWQIQSMDCGKFNRWIVASLIGDLSEKKIGNLGPDIFPAYLNDIKAKGCRPVKGCYSNNSYWSDWSD